MGCGGPRPMDMPCCGAKSRRGHAGCYGKLRLNALYLGKSAHMFFWCAGSVGRPACLPCSGAKSAYMPIGEPKCRCIHGGAAKITYMPYDGARYACMPFGGVISARMRGDWGKDHLDAQR